MVIGMHSVGHRDAVSCHRDALSGHRDALSLVIGMRRNRWSASERRWGTQRRITVPVSVVVRSCVWVRWWVGMVVRFVCVIRVPVCARAPRVCPVCVLEITHRHTFTFTQALHTPRRVPHSVGAARARFIARFLPIDFCEYDVE